ncbi:MAG TPA: DUF4174 domain-containing protein [Waterburya sp.]|jgi:hypothetical protein
MLIRCSILALLLLSVTGCSTTTQSLAQESATQLFVHNSETSTAAVAATPKVAVTSNSVANAGGSKVAFDMKTYQWKNRLLLVFSPSANSPAYQKQMQLFQSQQAGFQERDLLLVELLAEGTSRASGQILDKGDVAKMRSRFNIAPQDFRVILVGKDGTAKRRDSNPVQPKVIFNEIDAMPMRRREMRERSREG